MNRVDAINRGMNDTRPMDSVEIPSLKGKVSDEEWTIREDLAAAYRMVAYYGWDDLIFTHLSARIPGPEHHFLLNPYQLMFEEVTASSLVKVDVNGNPVDPTPFITAHTPALYHSPIFSLFTSTPPVGIKSIFGNNSFIPATNDGPRTFPGNNFTITHPAISASWISVGVIHPGIHKTLLI